MRIILVSLFLALSPQIFAKSDYGISGGRMMWKHFGTAQGLPSSEAYQVFQDSKGYIWIATDRGVVRYNGFEFKTFDLRNGLVDQVVFKFVEDNKGNVWFVSFSGQLCFWNGTKVIPYRYNHLISKYLGDFQSSYKSLIIEPNGTIYYALSSKGSIKITSDGRIIDYHKSVLYQHTIFVKEICGLPFVSNLGDDRKYKISKKPLYSFLNGKKQLLLQTMGNLRLAISHYDKSSYLLADYYVIDLNRPTRRVYNKALIGLDVDKDHVWLGQFSKGVRCYKRYDFGVRDKFTDYLKDYSVTSVLRDKQGGYWFSTLEKGVFYVSNLDVQNWNNIQNFPFSEIYSISGSKNELAIGTKKGYTVFSEKNKFQFFPVDAYFTPNIRFSKEGKLCASGLKKGKRAVNGKFDLQISKNNFYDISAINDIDKGMVSVSGPIILFESDSDDEIDTIANINITKGFNFIYAIEGISKDLYYFGGISGLRKLQHGTIKKPNEMDSRFNIRVDDIEYHKNHGLFVATRGGGVYLMKNDRIVKQFTKMNGLIDDFITDLYLDSSGTVYVSSYKGISRIQKLKNGEWLICNVNQKSGMISEECLSVFADENSVWCGTKAGLVKIPKKHFDRRRSWNGLFLQDLFAGKQRQSVKPNYQFYEGIPLIDIRIRNVNYNLGDRSFYRYRFSPLQNWIVSNSSRIILQYPTSGIYNLEIQQMDEFGNWTSPKKMVSINIELPFYKRWYFYLGLFAIGLWLVYLSFRARLRAVNRKYALQKQVNELEQKALSAQMNPHFIFNSLNSIQSFLLYEENEKAERYLLKFSKLIRSILSSSRETFISIDQEIELLTNYIELEQMRFQSKFEYRIENKLLSNTDLLMIPPMMIQPIVENAILHGLSKRDTGGLLVVSFQKETDVIVITVEDNGAGIQEKESQESKGHRSFGTQITRERMAIYEKNFNQRFSWKVERVSDDPNYPGTRVVLSIPVIKRHD
jgi:two-component sensor histidine kinase